MIEIVNSICLGIFLCIEGIRDLYKRKVSMVSVAIFAGMGILLWLPSIKETYVSGVGGIFVGVLFLVLAGISKEKIGYGDGWVLIVAGIYLGFKGVLGLLSMALFIASIISVILLLARKVSRKTELPFVTFMIPAYILLLVMI